MSVFPLSKWLVFVALLVTISTCISEEDANKSMGKTTEYQPGPTQHQEHIEKTTVDFSELNFSGDASAVAGLVMDRIAQEAKLASRLESLFQDAKTEECRALIAQHFGYFYKAIATETPLPFASTRFDSSCEDDEPWDFNNLPEGVHMGIIQNRTYQPPRNESTYISSEEVVLCYGILAHDSADATIRIIEALDEPSTKFVVHIDGKYEENYLKLKEYANKNHRVMVLDDPYRVRVNWGGFSMVNATLQILNYIDRNDINFTHFVHMASTSYPIVSNQRIRNTLADYPVDANFMHIILKPAMPAESIWNYFVECDDKLHRIHRLPILTKEENNAALYTGSQWFIISKEFAHFLANPQAEEGVFLRQYLEYIEHAVVADEHFFGTVLRNTRFCNKHHNWNFLHLTFDQWENEQDLSKRDKRKCMMPDPNHCGRSPTTLGIESIDILELSGDLFARKFVDSYDSRIKDAMDASRKIEAAKLDPNRSTGASTNDEVKAGSASENMKFEGHGTLIVATDTLHTSDPLCLGLGPRFSHVRLVPCFQDNVAPTLADNWETGAVILEEVQDHTRWSIGPCSSSGNLDRFNDGEIEVTPGPYMSTGPKCLITMMDGLRTGRCLDGESLDNQPGGPANAFPCTKRWSQYISFGNGIDVPDGTLHTVVPTFTQMRVNATGREQEPYMCLGVARRGDLDEGDWFEKRGEFWEDYEELDKDLEEIEAQHEGEFPPLQYWLGRQLMMTRCSNEGAVVEWTFVPFIEDDDEESVDSDSVTTIDETSEDKEL